MIVGRDFDQQNRGKSTRICHPCSPHKKIKMVTVYDGVKEKGVKGILAHSHAQAGEEAKPEPSRRQEQSESRLVRVPPACGSALWCWSLLRVSGAGAAAVDSCAGNAGRRGRSGKASRPCGCERGS